ncbi:hypothetical protein K7472_29445 [Streptomyces sp. PTM05]|uniref:Methyltransferase n=1 Tax=Streptantibioticus parmotrematis TaxID=2873249 RepID=A0ABS7R0F1_9ACTN|nr:hypothetical protein [Streptantibioticus parmotrematis]MBY8888941.1 hypothetical protein [Streptantibioticus parmotrematis]
MQADVYQAAGALEGRRFGIVYSGLGSLRWLTDIDRWARVAAALTTPGGLLYLADFHPFGDILADDCQTVARDYFRRTTLVWRAPGTYADPDARARHNTAYEWQHGLGDVVSAPRTRVRRPGGA